MQYFQIILLLFVIVNDKSTRAALEIDQNYNIATTPSGYQYYSGLPQYQYVSPTVSPLPTSTTPPLAPLLPSILSNQGQINLSQSGYNYQTPVSNNISLWTVPKYPKYENTDTNAISNIDDARRLKQNIAAFYLSLMGNNLYHNQGIACKFHTHGYFLPQARYIIPTQVQNAVADQQSNQNDENLLMNEQHMDNDYYNGHPENTDVIRSNEQSYYGQTPEANGDNAVTQINYGRNQLHQLQSSEAPVSNIRNHDIFSQGTPRPANNTTKVNAFQNHFQTNSSSTIETPLPPINFHSAPTIVAAFIPIISTARRQQVATNEEPVYAVGQKGLQHYAYRLSRPTVLTFANHAKPSNNLQLDNTHEQTDYQSNDLPIQVTAQSSIYTTDHLHQQQQQQQQQQLLQQRQSSIQSNLSNLYLPPTERFQPPYYK